MSGADAYKTLLPYLWEYEKTEILDYPIVYFFNVAERKKAISSNQSSQVILTLD